MYKYKVVKGIHSIDGRLVKVGGTVVLSKPVAELWPHLAGCFSQVPYDGGEHRGVAVEDAPAVVLPEEKIVEDVVEDPAEDTPEKPMPKPTPKPRQRRKPRQGKPASTVVNVTEGIL